MKTYFIHFIGKRILDNIAEAFSPKSPTKENNPNTDFDKKSHGDSKENLVTPSNLEVQDKKPSGRGRGRHRLYKEDTYISEPMEFKGEFVVSISTIASHCLKCIMKKSTNWQFEMSWHTQISEGTE